MRFFKNILVIISALLFVVCVGIDGWYLYVFYYAPDKLIDNTYEVGLQVLEDGTTDYFAKIKYHSNRNENGLECFDVQFNYLLDENKTAFFSQGLQFVGNTKTDKIDWQYYVDANFTKVEMSYVADSWYNQDRNYGFFGSYRTKDVTSKVYNYASGNSYKTTTISTNPINNDSVFKIQLGDDLFNMKFKGTSTEMEDDNFVYKEYGGYSFYFFWGVDNYNYYYAYYDSYYFSKLLYDAVKTLKPGTKQAFVFEFGDIFNYYKYDASKGSYSDTALKNADSVIENLKSYYSIYVEVVDDGVQKASDSLFNMVHGNANYNTTGQYDVDDYFVGRTVLKCDIYDFEFLNIIDNYYALKLKNSFIESYNENRDVLVLSIHIDLDVLKEKNIEFIGFADDSGLEKFVVLDCYTTETVNGEIQRVEVQL